VYLVQHSDVNDASLTGTMHGAECWTNQRLVRAVEPPLGHLSTKRNLNGWHLDVKAIQNPDKVAALREQIYLKSTWMTKLSLPSIVTDKHSQQSGKLQYRNVFREAASDSLGFRSTRRQDWFDDINVGIHELLKARNDAYPLNCKTQRLSVMICRD